MAGKKLEPGINPVLMTPLNEDGGLDIHTYHEVVPRLLDAGVHGLVVLGSMGELPYLSADERREAIEAVAAAANGKVQIIAGATAFGTDEAVRNAQDAVKAGADFLLVPFPVYFKAAFDDILDYFRRIAGESGAPILYYHFPGVTHLDLTGEQIASIFEIENVVGIKESIMDLPTIKKHISVFPDDITVYSGSSMVMREVMALGGLGAICPMPDLIPETVVTLFDACRSGDSEAADRAQEKIFDLAPLFYDSPLSLRELQKAILSSAADGEPMHSSGPAHAALKEALRLLGHPYSPLVKSPLPQLTADRAKQVEAILKRAGLI